MIDKHLKETRLYFANNALLAAREAKDGTQYINPNYGLTRYIKECVTDYKACLRGEFDDTTAHQQYYTYLKTGEMIGILPNPTKTNESRNFKTPETKEKGKVNMKTIEISESGLNSIRKTLVIALGIIDSALDSGTVNVPTETPTTETPVTETPVTETPVTETPVTEKSNIRGRILGDVRLRKCLGPETERPFKRKSRKTKIVTMYELAYNNTPTPAELNDPKFETLNAVTLANARLKLVNSIGTASKAAIKHFTKLVEDKKIKARDGSHEIKCLNAQIKTMTAENKRLTLLIEELAVSASEQLTAERSNEESKTPAVAEPIAETPAVAEPIAETPAVAEPETETPAVAEPITLAESIALAEPETETPAVVEPVVYEKCPLGAPDGYTMNPKEGFTYTEYKGWSDADLVRDNRMFKARIVSGAGYEKCPLGAPYGYVMNIAAHPYSYSEYKGWTDEQLINDNRMFKAQRVEGLPLKSATVEGKADANYDDLLELTRMLMVDGSDLTDLMNTVTNYAPTLETVRVEDMPALYSDLQKHRVDD